MSRLRLAYLPLLLIDLLFRLGGEALILADYAEECRERCRITFP